MNLTAAELKKLKASTCEDQWNAACDEIKAARQGQYPPDWFAKVMISGLMTEVAGSWS